ncbi:hypothetical protein FOA43_000830 [Brettanomyces nanus]|uniref:beta-glucosidase n=1 Tax=Eeniella nana TaxID=13502 RepID=A0A875S0X9_EENNA|nr:uncharacterized protein FOA43_000830 [Brettanomyces nanus]QPG73519.1 hypothetical protein FOA43_000830 [Brettanomyces nanus]
MLPVDQLVEQLTTEEKVSLIAAVDFWHTAKIDRLGIPSIQVSDGPNGVRGSRFSGGTPSACFPNGTCIASTFDAELVEKAGELMAIEAKHKGAQVILGPTLNIQRSPLGGRGFESFSEDPYLSGIIAASIVSGIQKSGDLAATVKHFVCNELEHERFSSNSVVSERALREIYLEPFRLAIKLANPKCLITSYNKINGIHNSESRKLLHDILREEWKWDGLIMSDWTGTYSCVDALKNGLDIEFPGPTKFRRWEVIKHLLMSKEGNLKETDIDERCKQVLKLVEYVSGNGTKLPFDRREDTKNNTSETSSFLRKIAADGIVLLKNDKNILPLSKEKSTVVIGPNSNALNTFSGGGSAFLRPYYVITPLEAIKNKVSGGKVDFTVGCHTFKTLSGLFEQMSNNLDSSKRGIGARFYTKPKKERAGNERPIDECVIKESFINLADYSNPAVDEQTKIFYVDFEGYFEPLETADYQFGFEVVGTAMLYIDEKLLIDNKNHQTKGAFCFGSGAVEKTTEVHLEAGKKYKITIEFGSGFTSPVAPNFTGGELQAGVTKVIDDEKEIEYAVELAKSHDNVILCIGLNNEWESEGYDREDMMLPRKTNDLVAAVIGANPNTVVVNQSGSPVEMPWLQSCSTLVQAWYGGNELGNAIADVLFGDVVPSGKLSLSWPFKNEDNPAFLNFHTEKGRVLYGEDVFVGYRYYEKLQRRVAFPYGFGLSYTTFKFENLKVDADDKKIDVSLKVSNTGDKYTGKEVIQLYVGAINPSIIRPVKELKAFAKAELKPGETTSVSFSLDLKRACSYFDEYQNKWCLEADKYQIHVGSSSDDIDLIGEFEVTNTVYWLEL